MVAHENFLQRIDSFEHFVYSKFKPSIDSNFYVLNEICKHASLLWHKRMSEWKEN